MCIAATEGSMAADYSGFVTAGLQGAKDKIAANAYQPYPAYTGSQKTNPYAGQQNAQGLASSGYDVNKAQYNGLGQSADQIRADFMAPVNQAWDKSQSQIANRFAANGLYGSLGGGLMSGALQDGAQNYATSIAQANTLANQNIMANEQNRVKAYNDAYAQQHTQNLDAWKSGLQTTDYNNQLLGNRANFNNSQIDAAYQDQLARRQDRQAYDQSQIENYLGLAGGGSPGYAAQLQSSAAQSAAKQAAAAQNSAAWLGLGGAAFGGLMKNPSAVGDIWGGISSFFK